MQGLRVFRLAVLLLGLALPVRLLGQAPATATCKDGTTSKAGKGACSHHGGIAKTMAPPAAAEATPAKPAATVSCKDGTSSKPGKGACSHHGGVGTAVAAAPANPPAAIPGNPPLPVTAKAKTTAPGTVPPDATALCKDGSSSHAQHHRGACSHHGGVKQWLKDVPK
jgi:hypothetical protein